MAKVKISAKNTSGVIQLERNMHDDAIVISGTMALENVTGELNAWIAEELESAARKINELEGIIGHIKAAVTSASTDMISVTEEKAMVKTSPFHSAKITLTVIVFLVDPEEAESIARKTLASIRKRCKSSGQVSSD